MTALVPMRPEAFPAFFEAAVAGYAADNIASGRWLEHEAEQLAGAETERLLPNGVALFALSLLVGAYAIGM